VQPALNTASNPVAPSATAPVQALNVSVAHGDQTVLHDLSFEVREGEVLVIIGASGCGKSSLLRDLIGLQAPARGRVLIEGQDLYGADGQVLAGLHRRFGVMFQAGALWSAMSVGDNLMLPMQLFTDWAAPVRALRARLKLALVGLDDAFELMPAQLSGGMRKRAALARALVLDPKLLFLDEPGSGLDPVNAARLDGLILQLRGQLGTTVVMVTHEIDSVFAVADRVLFLDEVEKTMTALDTPQALLAHGPLRVREFLQRGRAGIADTPAAALANAAPATPGSVQ